MSAVVKLFMNGRSQAIRLPAQYKLDAKEVCIESIAGGLWVTPIKPTPTNMGQWLEHFYATTEPFPDDFLSDRDNSPPQARDWS